MKIRAIQWTAVDIYLNLVRLPFDTAIRLFPDGGIGVRPAAQAAVDGADTGIRAIVATVLGDPVLADDATRQGRHGEREERDDGRGHASKGPRASQSNGQHERVSEPRATRRKAPPGGQREAAVERPTAAVEPSAAPAPQTAPGRARAAAITGTAGRTVPQAAGSSASPRAPDILAAEDQALPVSADSASSKPSHEDIAARAYELYERGVPGDADSHWEAAERELTSESR